MIKKLCTIVLLALIIVPASVMAAGMNGSGAGIQTLSVNALQFQQGGESQATKGPYMFSSQNGVGIGDDKGNGDLLKICTQDQLQNRSRWHTGIQRASEIISPESLETGTTTGDQLQTKDRLQTMIRIRLQLMDGSCGNCPKLTTSS